MGAISTGNAEHYGWGETCDGWHLLASDNLSVIEERMPPGTSEQRHRHVKARQFFYVLEGEGTARCDGKTMPIKRGDALLLRPGSEHVIENTGPGKLYTLTVMTPNEGFAELIRSGQPVDLDDEDLKVLGAAGQWTKS